MASLSTFSDIHVCDKPNCNNEGTKRCSACLKELYCSGDCQKSHWKIHKILCPFKKKKDRLPLKEIAADMFILQDLANKQKIGSDSQIQILLYGIEFANHQFGERIHGHHYERNGDFQDYLSLDFMSYFPFYHPLGEAFMIKTEFVDDFNTKQELMKKAIKYFHMAVPILEATLADFESESVDNDNILGKNDVYEFLSNSKASLGLCHVALERYVVGKENYNEAVRYGKKVTVKDKSVNLIFTGIKGLGDIVYNQSRFQEAKVLREDLYNLVAVAYNPIHPLVLKAADLLINTLINLNEYDDGERYARVTYEELTRPHDPEDEDVADVAMSLAICTSSLVRQSGVRKEGDLKESEMLARKVVRIKERLFSHTHCLLARPLSTLADILILKGKNDDELRELLERSLALTKKSVADNDLEVAIKNFKLANFHFLVSLQSGFEHAMLNTLPSMDCKKDLRLAEPYAREAIRISTLNLGINDPHTMHYKEFLSQILSQINS